METSIPKKLVFIMGASGGIGAAIAYSFAAKGFDLFLAARRIELLESIKLKLEKMFHINCHIAKCDATNLDDYKHLANDCYAAFGIPNYIIHNSGISRTDDFNNLDTQVIKDIYDVNVFSILHSLEAFTAIMKKTEEPITFAAVTSLAEARGIPGNAGYTSSKIAASHLLEAARAQLSRTNIRVATIKPGFIKTDMTSRNSFPMPFLLTAEQAGEIICDKLLEGKLHISFPMPTAFISWIGKLIPASIYDFFASKFKKNMLQD
jgi:short-subunit dehydrogenase